MTNNERTIPQSPEAPPATPAGHDIFTDPALQQSLKEDPVFRFLQRNWRQVLLVVGCVVALVYARQVFQDTRVADMERSADIFNRARTEYEQIVSLERQLGDARKRLAESEKIAAAPKDGVKKDEKVDSTPATRVADLEKQVGDSRRRIEGHLGALADARSPYRELGVLYKGLLARETAEAGKSVAAMRGAFGIESGVPTLGDKPALPVELQVMALARTLIDSPETRGDGVAALGELAARGVYTRVSAGLALAQIANSEAERESARKLLEGILTAQPEQESFIAPELARLNAAK
ncbi:MAG: hypothetical protein RL417_1031 [Pseudomonadota bacterium]